MRVYMCVYARTCIFVSFALQAVINSTITPNMTFTKTSQKFGQWSDVRANTVYGLGFSSEAELGKVCVALSSRRKQHKSFCIVLSEEYSSLTVYRKVSRGKRGHQVS